MEPIIGREKELAALTAYNQSGKAEFVAVYGRRRVGKTYLIHNYFQGQFAFEVTGIIDGTKAEQMLAFVMALRAKGQEVLGIPKSWTEVFALLQELLERFPKDRRCVVFMDELPCFDTPRSDFVRAFGHFWNAWASKRSNILLLICGSATSWIVRNVIDSRGGLHDRITHEIHLHPFVLQEVERYLSAHHFSWSRLSILQLYMILGGIPYYLSLLDAEKSMAQNIDSLFFADDAELSREFSRLYKSLFSTPEPYMRIIELLGANKSGLTREEIANKMSKSSGGSLSVLIEDLINCDLIRSFNTREKKIQKKNCIYQLIDFYSIFYLNFCKKPITETEYWSKMQQSTMMNTWLGLAFERVCMAHIPQIKHALGIDRIYVEYYAWRSKVSTPASQIDLLLERADQIVNLCEIKYSASTYSLTAKESEKLRIRMDNFRQETNLRYGIFLTMLTTYGLARNAYADDVKAVVTMDDLFVPV